MSTGARCQTSLCSAAHGATIVRSAGGWACKCDASGVWGGRFCNESQCGPGTPALSDSGWSCRCPDAYDPSDALCSGSCAANAARGTDGVCRCNFPFSGRFCDVNQCTWDSSVNRYTAITGGYQAGASACACFSNWWVGTFCNISRCGALGTPVPYTGAVDLRKPASCACMKDVAVADSRQLNIAGGFVCQHVTGCTGCAYNPTDGGCSGGTTDPYCAAGTSKLGTTPTSAPTGAPSTSAPTSEGATGTPTGAPTTRAPTARPTTLAPTRAPTAAPTSAAPAPAPSIGGIACFVCPSDPTRCCDATTGAVVPSPAPAPAPVQGGNLTIPTVPTDSPAPVPSAGERSHAVQWALALLPLMLALFFATDNE